MNLEFNRLKKIKDLKIETVNQIQMTFSDF